MGVNIGNKAAILLTGTISPNSIYTEYNDPRKRLQDHITAIRFYLEKMPGHDIYFLENSNFRLEDSEDFNLLLADPRLHVLRYPPSDRFNEGKGYQEFEVLDKAMEQLSTKYRAFVKITGRYIVTNIAALIKNNVKGVVVDLHRRDKRAATYLIHFTPGFYLEHLKGLYRRVNDSQGLNIEHVVYARIQERDLTRQSRLFDRTPLLQGITGSYGIQMKRNPLRVLVRNAERFIYRMIGVKSFFY